MYPALKSVPQNEIVKPRAQNHAFLLRALLFLGSLAYAACSETKRIDVTEPDSGRTSSDQDASIKASPTSDRSSSATDSSTTKREGPWGCYLSDSHACDCSLESEAACDGVGFWVEGCSSCDVPTNDAGVDAQVTFDDSDASTLAPGCYDPGSHACACDTNESACSSANGIWTDRCECALDDAGIVDASTCQAPDASSDAGSDADL